MKETNEFLTLKIKFFKTVLILFGLMAFVMGITRFIEQDYYQFFVDIFLIILIVIGYLKINNQNFYIVFRTVLFLGFLVALSLVIIMNESPMRFIWFTTVVYGMFYILGKREGWWWVFIISLVLMVIHVYDCAIMGLDNKDFFTWIFNMLIILVVVNWYEKIKESVLQKQKDIQHFLEKEVNIKTAQLQEINNELEERIKHEVDKSLNREKIMLHQTRLAQMGEMLSMIAHQWRQPLAAISATSATIELKASMNKLDNEDIQKKSQAISDYSQHLSKTIDDFRNFFKPLKEKNETTYDEIIHSVLNIMEASLKSKNIQLIKNLNCHETFHTYPSEIKQVLLNLITNAEEALVESIVEKPYIQIMTYRKEDQYVLEVSDNAGGISENSIDYIFDPYFSTKKAKDGTGLGLYMSKMIIEDHCAGKLSIHNGQDGAVFTISLKESV